MSFSCLSALGDWSLYGEGGGGVESQVQNLLRPPLKTGYKDVKGWKLFATPFQQVQDMTAFVIHYCFITHFNTTIHFL